MNIYNITFIVEEKIEKDWIEYMDRVILPELGKNVHQVDLLKVTFEEGVDNVKGTTFSVQFYCKDKEMIDWVKILVTKCFFKNFTENLIKIGWLSQVN